MSLIKSKVFGALVVLNLIILGGLYQYSDTATGDGASTAPDVTIDAVTQTAAPATNLATLETLKPAGKATREETSDEEEISDELAALFDNALADLGAIDEDDAAYVNALSGDSDIQVRHADHLNKVDISALVVKSRARPNKNASVEDKLTAAVKDLVGAIDDKSEKSYISALDREARVRRNEVRLIKVVAGDTLWKIAARAYGDGNLYKKIYKANPHIRNPDMIEVGEMLRVPL